MLKQTLDEEGRFAFTTHVSGEHKICISMNTENLGGQQIEVVRRVCLPCRSQRC